MYEEEYFVRHKILMEKFRNQSHHKENRDNGHGLISDGIIDYRSWDEQDVKILYLLKEAYAIESEGFNLANWVKESGGKGITWSKIASRTYAIQHTNPETLADFKEVEKQKQAEMNRRIAVVNIKKSGGKSSSNDEDLQAYAKKDRDLLKEQIELIAPDIIVCGYTMRYLSQIVGEESIKEDDRHNPNWFYKIEISGKLVTVLDYYHPASQYPELLDFYGLAAIYQKSLLSK